MSTVLIACGGTGGHLSPGIALAEGVRARGHSPILLISHKSVDTRLASAYPELRFERIPAAPMGGSPKVLLKFLVTQTKGFFAAWRMISREKPAVIVGFGGFTTAAVILAGKMRGIPVALHEANRVPGKAIRKLAGLATRIWLPPGVDLAGAAKDKIREALLPVRPEIRRGDRAQACLDLGLDPSRPVLTIFAGSQGATPLNNWAKDNLDALAVAGIQLYAVSGPGKSGDETIEKQGPDGRPVLMKFTPFCDRVATLLSASDLVLARAGAGTLSELIRCGTPSILVPYPQAADNHQAANAEWLSTQGGAVTIDQTQMNAVLPRVVHLLGEAGKDELDQIRSILAAIDSVDPVEQMMTDMASWSNFGISKPE